MRDPYSTCPTQIQPRKHAPGRADCLASTPQHEVHHADHNASARKDLDNVVVIGDLSDVWNAPKVIDEAH